MKVEHEAKWGLHDHPADRAVRCSPVPCGLEVLDGYLQVVRADEQIDVGQRPLRRVAVQPVLQERTLDRHHRNSSLAERPSDVAHELGGEQRGGSAASGGVSVHWGLRHFGVLS